MKRDMDLVRKLLVYFADRTETQAVDVAEIPGNYDPALIGYHLNLLYEAGWLVAEPEKTKMGRVIRVHAFALTWSGHDFLDSIRSDSTWRKIKTNMKKVGGAASVDIMKSLAIHHAKTALGISDG